MNMHKHLPTLAALVFALTFSATPSWAENSSSAAIPNPAPAHPELRPVFEAFGGKAGITALMDDFMVILLDDPRMRAEITAAVRAALTDDYRFERRGPVEIKGIGAIETWWLLGRKTAA